MNARTIAGKRKSDSADQATYFHCSSFVAYGPTVGTFGRGQVLITVYQEHQDLLFLHAVTHNSGHHKQAYIRVA